MGSERGGQSGPRWPREGRGHFSKSQKRDVMKGRGEETPQGVCPTQGTEQPPVVAGTGVGMVGLGCAGA